MLTNGRFSSKTVRPARQLGGGCLALFGLPFLAGGLAVLYFLYLPTLATWWSARLWVERPCWIEEAALETKTGRKGGQTYKATARYRYQIEGKDFHSTAVSLSEGSDNLGDFQQRVAAELELFEGRDQAFRCYVNPRQPEQAVLYRELRWGLLLLSSIFPLVFPVAGLGVMSLGLRQAREARAGRLLAERHPGEPWRWRPEWDGETILPEKHHSMLGTLLGLWMLMVQAPLAAAILLSGAAEKEPLALLGLLPMGVGLLVLFITWRGAVARRRLGRPVLWLRQRPIVPGKMMEGELRFDRVLSPLLNLDVRVLCQRHITRGTGKGRNTVKETVWEERETLPATEARRDVQGSSLPLRVALPAGLPATAVEDVAYVADDEVKHVWTMELTPAGSTRGKMVLPLPVFRPLGKHGSDSTEDEALAMADQEFEEEALALTTEQLTERLAQRKVRAEFDAAGMPTLIDCPPGRLRSSAWFMVFFGLVWGAAFVGLFKGGAPFIFILVWGVSTPLILFSGLWSLLHRRTVEILGPELRVIDQTTPLYRKVQTFEARHFVEFTPDCNMQYGNQFYYRVRAETIFGKKFTIADGITESLTAESLAERLQQWAGKP